ncbi:MAG: hypothetical protein ABI553_03850 [Chloroflexota bacterium]
MDLLRASEVSLKLRHLHDDGSWASFEPARSHHDPSDHDPEREWANGTIYKCTSCDEEVLVAPVAEPGPRRD